MNLALAKKVLKNAQSLGIREYCLCAGARNSPLVFLLAAAEGIQVYNFFEERSAAFFALGRIKESGRPVAVVTTSGTAVAELLPAAVEATYAGLPLVLITADRPRSYRGTGAPQTIQQMGIFSHYVQTTWDIESLDEDLPIDTWACTQPLHINVCFNEPMINGVIESLNLTPAKNISRPKINFQSQTQKIQKPLIVVGGLRESERAPVVEFLKNLEAPIYAESISGLRGHREIQGNLLWQGEKLAPTFFEQGICRSVLRIGSVPTLRFWRDLEDRFQKIPVYSISNEEWTGLSRRVHHNINFVNLNKLEVHNVDPAQMDAIQKMDLEAQQSFLAQLDKYPRSEPGLLHRLSHQLKNQSVYLGNSLPIREWDLVSGRDTVFARVEANRGANGIDGQISTFLGWSESERFSESWALLGDLTTLYDLSAPWITPALTSAIKRRIVVINNQGGQIFKKIFKNEAFLNSHNLNFKNWAAMWGWDYQEWSEIPTNIDFPATNLVIELKPSSSQSDEFWR